MDMKHHYLKLFTSIELIIIVAGMTLKISFDLEIPGTRYLITTTKMKQVIPDEPILDVNIANRKLLVPFFSH